MKLRSILTLCSFLSLTLCADEGMWTFDKLPKDSIYQNYGVRLTESWIRHVRLSSLRVSLGGSASFVSSQGLVMTNHHVGAKAIYNLSSDQKNYMKDGFYAASFDEELSCPNMHVDQLIEIRDVTEEVNQVLSPSMTFPEKEEARKKVLAKLKEQLTKESGLKVEDVVLFQGAKYHLYLYKRFTDIRLVMAPEKAIAFFGGDIENFEYPRYDLDVCFFRVYENGKPLSTKDFLSWSPVGPIIGEPLFVVGNPGSTKRLYTASHYRFLRDTSLPLLLDFLQKKITLLEEFSKGNDEKERQALQYLFSLRNSQKALSQQQQALESLPIIDDKAAKEEDLMKALSLKEKEPWNDLDQALQQLKTYYSSYFYLERYGFIFCKEYVYARNLVRYAQEIQKPNNERLKEYQTSEIPSFERQLFSKEPLYTDLEALMLAEALQDLSSELGQNNPVVISILDGITPEQKAQEIIKTTQMGSLDFRKELFENPSLIEKSHDPMILLVKKIDPLSRQMRGQYEDEFDSVQKSSYASIIGLYFNRYGDTLYPDATFTPRLSIGVMKGYFDEGVFVDPMTYYSGLFFENKKHENKPPYDLPERWLTLAPTLNQSTPLNFVSTNDIIGGNSGSPVINQKGEVVGLIFDGNKNSQVWDLEYSDIKARAVSVHTTGIMYALEKVYEATRLVEEIRSSTK